MGDRRRLLALITGFTLWFLAGILLRGYLEASMIRHSLVQIPLLAISGGMLVARRGPVSPDPMALPALLVALFTSAIWMLPRMLDASLADQSAELAKLITIPLLIGVPLAWSWPRLDGLVRAFVWANLVSMLLTLGWLYKAAPVRVCNFYLVEDQKLVGTALLVLAAVVSLGWLPRLFHGTATAPSIHDVS
jgi:hypothetical protein